MLENTPQLEGEKKGSLKTRGQKASKVCGKPPMKSGNQKTQHQGVKREKKRGVKKRVCNPPVNPIIGRLKKGKWTRTEGISLKKVSRKPGLPALRPKSQIGNPLIPLKKPKWPPWQPQKGERRAFGKNGGIKATLGKNSCGNQGLLEINGLANPKNGQKFRNPG